MINESIKTDTESSEQSNY